MKYFLMTTLNHSTLFAGMKHNKADQELLEIMKKNLGDKVLNTVIPFSRAIKNSISYRITASEYMSWINPARCYEQLADEIIHTVEQ